MASQRKIPTILFRIDFIYKGNSLVELKDYTHNTLVSQATNDFRHRQKLEWWFDNPNITYRIVKDRQWIEEHPEEYKDYLDYMKSMKKKKKQKEERKQKRIQDEEIFENEQDTQDRVICPRCNEHMDKDNDTCLNCGYPSKEMHKTQSWLFRALYIEGKKRIIQE